MSSEPGVSSYDKIFAHLADTPDFQDVRVRWNQRLQEAKFDGWEFGYEMNYSTKQMEVTSKLLVLAGAERRQICTDTNYPLGLNPLIPGRGLLTDDEAAAVVKRNFGTKRCRTYFCKIQKVIEGEKKGKGQRAGFAEWARQKLDAETADAIIAAKDRIRSAAKEASLSEDFEFEKRRFFERQVIGEIKAVVLKYYDRVDPSVVKEALDEVMAHSVMDS